MLFFEKWKDSQFSCLCVELLYFSWFCLYSDFRRDELLAVAAASTNAIRINTIWIQGSWIEYVHKSHVKGEGLDYKKIIFSTAGEHMLFVGATRKLILQNFSFSWKKKKNSNTPPRKIFFQGIAINWDIFLLFLTKTNCNQTWIYYCVEKFFFFFLIFVSFHIFCAKKCVHKYAQCKSPTKHMNILGE